MAQLVDWSVCRDWIAISGDRNWTVVFPLLRR